jgi:hypothetical protein
MHNVWLSTTTKIIKYIKKQENIVHSHKKINRIVSEETQMLELLNKDLNQLP